MKLIKAQVHQYRTIRDTGVFDVDAFKTIFVGPNESGKRAILEALQHLNPPPGERPLSAEHDYPRSERGDIAAGGFNPADITISKGWFSLEKDDKASVPAGYADAIYVRGRRLDNTTWHRFEGGPSLPAFASVRDDLARLALLADGRLDSAGPPRPDSPGAKLAALSEGLEQQNSVEAADFAALIVWLDAMLPDLPASDSSQLARHRALRASMQMFLSRQVALEEAQKRLPVFILFRKNIRFLPLSHLARLAARLESTKLAWARHDEGHRCLLKLLGITARELLALTVPRKPDVHVAVEKHGQRLRLLQCRLDAIGDQLSRDMVSMRPSSEEGEPVGRVNIVLDQQCLAATVEDAFAHETELGRCSERLQWLISFFIVFNAKMQGVDSKAILLLDEPGSAVHGSIREESMKMVSRLARDHQTLYTTNVQSMVGPDELKLVRMVEMSARNTGAFIESAEMPRVAEVCGYDLTQSLFTKQRNLVLEGISDHLYVEALSQLLKAAGESPLRQNIALLPAASAGQVVYYATLLRAQNLKVAALLDSDVCGELATKDDALVDALGGSRILRTREAYSGTVLSPEIEDLLRATLIALSLTVFQCDVGVVADSQPHRAILAIFADEIDNFSKLKLAEAFVRWCRDHTIADLPVAEAIAARKLVALINRSLE